MRMYVMVRFNGGLYTRGHLLSRPVYDGKTYFEGWKFYPHTDTHKPSRKHHRTPAEAVPRWVGEYVLMSPEDRLLELGRRFDVDVVLGSNAPTTSVKGRV